MPVGLMVSTNPVYLTALVIAANKEILQLVTTILKLDNFSCQTAETDEMGYQLAKAESPDVIVALADKDHDKALLCKKVREDRQLAELPLVILTTSGNSQSYARYFSYGCDQVLPIPFKCSQLFEVVHKATALNSQRKDDRIKVLYRSGQSEFVTPLKLNQLLASRELLCFQRKDGIASIGRDPIRCYTKADYQGPERRNQAS